MLLSLNKKRSQSREAITSMVKHSLNEIFNTLSEDEQIKLLKTIVEITEGRIFVEYEFSVAIRRLTEIHITHGKIDEAAKLIQDIQIETFGSLERAYKVEYILFQMKTLLRKQDYIRVLIVSNKIARKHLNEEGIEKLKFEFYTLMIKYYLHEEKFIDASKSYKILYDFIKEIEIKLQNNKDNQIGQISLNNMTDLLRTTNKSILFINYVMYLSICPPVLETKNMFNELNLFYKKDLEEHTDMHRIVKLRLSDEIVQITSTFLEDFLRYPIFAQDVENLENPNAERQFKLFRKFWVQHDLIIFQKYFSQIRLQRIGDMIGCGIPEVESELADMVINGYIYAKINRIASTVNFRKRQNPGDKLDDLNHDLSKMLEKLENTCHLIHKENLKHDIK